MTAKREYEAISDGIVARHLLTSIDEAEWANSDEPARRAFLRLSRRNFDQAPVRSQGSLAGHVRTRDLASSAGSVSAFVRPLTSDSFVSASATVADVIQALLPDRDLVFVIDGRQAIGFVTASDFNKHAGRTHFYLLLAELEMTLADLVSRSVRDLDSALAVLDGPSQATIRRRYRGDVAEGVEANLAAAMDLRHLLLVAPQSDRLRAALRRGRDAAWEVAVSELADLRNAVMHPTKQFVGRKRTLRDLAATEAWVRLRLARLGHGSTSKRTNRRLRRASALATKRNGILPAVSGSPPPARGPCQFLTLRGLPCRNQGRYLVDGRWSCSRSHRG
jgi:hypothetical protein